ncbi:unnamed protein product, partial [Iphiclides podalirius]
MFRHCAVCPAATLGSFAENIKESDSFRGGTWCNYKDARKSDTQTLASSSQRASSRLDKHRDGLVERPTVTQRDPRHLGAVSGRFLFARAPRRGRRARAARGTYAPSGIELACGLSHKTCGHVTAISSDLYHTVALHSGYLRGINGQLSEQLPLTVQCGDASRRRQVALARRRKNPPSPCGASPNHIARRNIDRAH